MRVCPKCNTEYDDEFMFCGRCGEKLQKKIVVMEEATEQNNIEQKFCPYCGKEIDADSNFCPFCRRSLSEKETENNIEESIKNTEIDNSDITCSKWGTFVAVIKSILCLFGWFLVILLSKACGRGFSHAYPFASFIFGIIIFVLVIGYYVYSWISSRKE